MVVFLLLACNIVQYGIHGTCTGTGIATLKAKMSTVVKILTLRNFSQYD